MSWFCQGQLQIFAKVAVSQKRPDVHKIVLSIKLRRLTGLLKMSQGIPIYQGKEEQIWGGILAAQCK